MTYVELARDHTYDDENQIEATGKLFNASLVQRRHGNKRTMLFVQGANGNTGTRKPGITFCWYTTEPSKITGEELLPLRSEAVWIASAAPSRHLSPERPAHLRP